MSTRRGINHNDTVDHRDTETQRKGWLSVSVSPWPIFSVPSCDLGVLRQLVHA